MNPRPSRVTPTHLTYAASRLTERDRHVVHDCYEHGALTTDQIARLHFGRGRTARARLSHLYQLRVLDRFRPALPAGHGTAPYHWIPDEVGAHVIAAMLLRDRAELRWRHAANLAFSESATLGHRMAVNEFFVRLAVEARAAGGALREWYGERTTQRLLAGIVAPDGYGVLALPDHPHLHLLLELDRGTEPLRRIRDKVDRYIKAIPRSELADANPLILFAAPANRRAQGIERLTASNRLDITTAVWAPTSSGETLPLALGARVGLGLR
jgi:protein involved in plasmid replication-relaxation